MGYSNPPIPWTQFERALSDRGRPGTTAAGDGGDSPAWSRKRAPYTPAAIDDDSEPVVPYAELHAHSTFSFLDGASQPEQLFEEAARLHLHGLALTDHDGLYGAARMAEVAESYPDVLTVYGTELSLGLTEPQNGVPDPEGTHLLLLARGQEGYHRLAAAVTSAHLADDAEKGKPRYDIDDLADRSAGHWQVLTGCRKGTVRSALDAGGASAAEQALRVLLDRFGRDNVTVELFDHGDPLDSSRNDVLAELAGRFELDVVATGNVHYATPDRFRIASALAAVRARRSLDELDGWLPAADTAHLRSGVEMQARFARYPGAVERSATLADDLAFRLKSVAPGLPAVEVPEPHTTPMSWLRELVWAGAERLYPAADGDQGAAAPGAGQDAAPGAAGLGAAAPGAADQDAGQEAGPGHGVDPSKRDRIERELAVIEEKDFPGYFLIVRDLVQFARGRGILCQGRGSAANSAVCYLLEITAVDSIRYGLPFERFLSSMRDEEPDIDVDFDSDRREEVIQYVYAKYGRFNAAQVANVITYRPKFAVRDMAKALGHSPGQQDAWSKQVERWGSVVESDDHDIPDEVVGLAREVLGFPRHLGIHSGGMVLTNRPVGEVVPIEHARMDGRTVLQWDKDDCAYMGLVKFDLLGLGMLAALQYSFDLADEHCGERWDMHSMPKEEQGVYDQLCRADTVGVFQVESRAQMGTLPRLLPRRFYDLVIEVALVRPGPIQGGAVHPYIRRRTGEEPITYLHPSLEPVLERTLGVPLFQEQLMQMAMTVGGCSGEDADQLRRAMGSKRGLVKIEGLRNTLYAGMAEKGITGEDADTIYMKIQAFANFGFAESHSISFALIVYASAWMRLHYPGAFLAALLRAQPMGFYSPQTLVADARRHGVEVRRPDILRSGVDATLEPLDDTGRADSDGVGPADKDGVGPADSGGVGPVDSGGVGHADSDGLGPVDSGGDGPGARTDAHRPGGTAPAGSNGGSDADGRHGHLTGSDSCLAEEQPPVQPFDKGQHFDTDDHRRDGRFAVRLGLVEVSSLGRRSAERIVAERDANGPFRDMSDLARRVGLTTAQLEALAAADAFAGFDIDRRSGMWSAAQAAAERADQLPDTQVFVQPPLFGQLTDGDTLIADIWSTGLSPDDHPIRHARDTLSSRGVMSVADLMVAETGRRIEVGGIVTHRQRPATASGITFLNVEDETGLVNVICSVGVWTRFRRVAREAPALIVRGILERSPDGVVNVVADHLERLPLAVRTTSRDFH